MDPLPNPTSTITPPKGWATDKKQLAIDYNWRYNNSVGQVMAKNHGLKSPQPVMCNTGESGDCLYMLKSGSKFYLWNQIEGNVWEVEEPTVLEDIVAEIAKLGVESLKIKQVSQVST